MSQDSEKPQNRLLTYDTIFDVIVKRIPEFSTSVAQHLETYGELLPHVLMGDFTRYLSSLCCASPANQDYALSQCQQALSILENAMNSNDPKLQELIAVSFVENLNPSDECYKCMKSKLGPSLLSQLLEYEK